MSSVKTIRPLSSRPSIRPNDPWRYGEPALAEVMEDPLVHLVMKRDGLVPQDVWPVLCRARVRVCPVTSQAA
jgi:hypothetical protein